MLSDEVARYVALYRSLGLKFDNEERILQSFATYAEAYGDQHTRTDRIFDWCRSASSPTRARTFYAAIRRFCVFLHAEHPQHEIPPAGAFGRGRRPRPAPHLLEPHHVRALMMAAIELPPKGSISPHTYHHLFGLLAATGLRISEALALKRDHLTDDGLIVRSGKLGKSRLLPIHPTTRQALNRYLAVRDRLNVAGDDLFVVTTGRAPQKSTVYQVFRRLAHQLGIRDLGRMPGPRVHDLRHTFAARSLEAAVPREGGMTALAPHLTAFLREHLPRERNASPHTVATYAHCFALLVRFAAKQLDRRPSDLEIEDLGPDLVLRFLDEIETDRGNSARTRNARLIAIRSFFRYVEYQAPVCLDQVLRIRALPKKRTDAALIDHLTREEIQALLAAPDVRTASGARDRAMLHLTYAGGLRAAELLSLRLEDFPDRSLATVRIKGKGRRERVLPLWRETQAMLRAWLAVRPQAKTPELFLNRNGEPMTRDGFAHRLAQHVAVAAEKQPSLLRKRVTPHVLRHSCAMHTLAATGDIRKVALWLGHASIRTTETYLRVDPAEKLAVLAAHAPPPVKPGRFRRRTSSWPCSPRCGTRLRE